MAFLVLQALFPSANASATQQLVGRVATPAAMAHLHVFRSPRELDGHIQRMRQFLNETMTRARSAPLEVQQSLLALEGRMETALQQRARKLAKLHLMMTAQHHREKRVAPLIPVAIGALVFSSFVALGLGIANRVQLEELQQQVEGMEERQNEILTSIETLEDTFNANSAKVTQALEQGKWRDFVQSAETEVRFGFEELDDKLDSWTQGFYHLLHGKLDPAFVSPAELRTGLDSIQSLAQEQGMRVVPFAAEVELLFTMPISGILNDTGLHIFITVPLLPGGAPVLQLYKVGHEPVELHEGKYVDFSLDRDYLAVDQSRSVHVDFSAAELSTCLQHKSTYFCDKRTLLTKPTTCAAALFFGDKKAAGRVCTRTIARRDVLVLPDTNSTFVLNVWTSQAQTVVQVCPGKADKPLQRIEGHQKIDMGPGCSLRTENTVTYHTHQLPRLDIACKTEDWTVPELLGDLPLEEALGLLEKVDLQEVRVGHHSALQHRRKTTAALIVGLACSVLLCLFILLVCARVTFLICQARNRRRQGQQDVPPPPPDDHQLAEVDD
jgi:hypothetical protein